MNSKADQNISLLSFRAAALLAILILVVASGAGRTQEAGPGKSDEAPPAARSGPPKPTPKQTPPKNESDKPKYTLQRLRGKMVYLAEAMKRLHGTESDADARQSAVALETSDGHLHPILKDARGRGFWMDERLRGIELELLVCAYPGSPVVQVVRVYSLKNGQRFELDYWCDICAIVMYELKECECCQGPTRIRTRLVDEKTGEAARQ